MKSGERGHEESHAVHGLLKSYFRNSRQEGPQVAHHTRAMTKGSTCGETTRWREYDHTEFFTKWLEREIKYKGNFTK